MTHPALAHRHDPDLAGLHWGRAGASGAPFAGRPAVLTDAEAEDRLVRHWRARYQVFDLAQAGERQAYLAVRDRMLSHWYRLLRFKELDGERVAMEWAEAYEVDPAAPPPTFPQER